MGKSGGFTFLVVYLLLAVFVGFTIMITELSLSRRTGLGIIGTYNKVSKKFKCLLKSCPYAKISFTLAYFPPCVNSLFIIFIELWLYIL